MAAPSRPRVRLPATRRFGGALEGSSLRVLTCRFPPVPLRPLRTLAVSSPQILIWGSGWWGFRYID